MGTGKAGSGDADKAIDLDFTGVFKLADLKPPPPPPPPRRIPENILIGSRSLAEGNYFVNVSRPRPARQVDPKKTTILIVEDDLPTLNMLDMLLSRAAGYQTRRAYDVQTFVQAIQKVAAGGCSDPGCQSARGSERFQDTRQDPRASRRCATCR